MIQKLLKSGLILILSCLAFQSNAVAQEISELPLLAKDGIFHSPRGHKGNHGKHGRRGKRGQAGATGATGASGQSIVSEINGYVFGPGTNPFITFSTVGFLNGVTYDGIDMFTIQTAGDYRISYTLNGLSLSMSGETITILSINGVDVAGSRTVTFRGSFRDMTVVYEGIFTLNAGDTIRVRAIAGNLGVSNGSFMVMKLNN